MNKKPDRPTAMLNIINLVRDDFPFYAPESQICGDTCVGCPKKLLELVDTELIDWEYKLECGEVPDFNEIDKLAKLCKNVRRSLVRNGVVPKLES
ncbi:hypothetical protein GCM10007916_11360 [Psychromonas marina]|uniref:Uncharacterized protein n=1 Tax=Psychromonas marina TaxID=88364 RepID=A0ABQ6DYJ6_9GAMM|nr:hypothetical protein [Psychromonas marina]GLS90069.1 hypothetical protein GCM10007916_11360 [Psychromonas marina]